ncbi:LOW QUALITY PROTEIN: amiloride-sensitive sodium channel subunit alpha-like [Hydractinia symbiolongicarpus]|uniref:LOW QUALITY PROTEIN: amiloride-sensitive sodium channel subunit alpha-like n=1 Tax=Hydractinia symbiolongicarpus TaxID=13093 RepID=UPI00254B9CC2|nr:LOW QUALITY PROTEIN: amiloride-sensitive sodium channel subunit alpha-like [Hydractinia symbiolongicarpus]
MELNAAVSKDTQTSSAKKLLSRFAENTTAHGFAQIALTKNCWVKLFWLLAITACHIGIYFQIKPLLTRYAKKPVVTKIYQTTDNLMTFPVVTICNMNPVRKKYADAIFNATTDEFEADSNNTNTSNASVSTSLQMTQTTLGKDKTVKESILSNLSFNLGDKIFEYGHQFESMLSKCEWNLFYDCKNLIYWTKFGIGSMVTVLLSIAVMHATTKLSQFCTHRKQINEILLLELDISFNDYYLPLTKKAGIILHVSDHDVAKDITSQSHYLSPGYEHLVSMEKTKRKRADPFKNKTCIEHYETDFGKQPFNDQRIVKKYTNKICMDVCFAQTAIKRCNCTPFWLPSLNGSRRCVFGDAKCALDVDYEYSRSNLSCLAGCKFPCDEINYKLSISSAKFPLDEKETGAQNKLGVALSFGRRQTVVMQDEEYYMIQNLLSDIGGQLGLWSGVSVLTLVEVIFFLAYGVRIFGEWTVILKKRR